MSSANERAAKKQVEMKNLESKLSDEARQKGVRSGSLGGMLRELGYPDIVAEKRLEDIFREVHGDRYKKEYGREIPDEVVKRNVARLMKDFHR